MNLTDLACRIEEGNKEDQGRLAAIALDAESTMNAAAAALGATQTQYDAADAAANEFEGPATEARGRHAALLKELEAAK